MPRIQGLTLRTETLDQTNTSIVNNDVRIVWEAKLHSVKFCVYAKTNSTTLGCEKRRLETNHWKQITQGTACSRAKSFTV